MKKHGSMMGARLLGLLVAAAMIASCVPADNTGQNGSTDAGGSTGAGDGAGAASEVTPTQEGVPATGQEATTESTPTEKPQEQSTPTEGQPTEAAAQETPTAGDQAAAAATPEGTETFFPTVENVATFPDPVGFTWAPVVSGLAQPLDLASPAGDQRLFILEQPGVIRIVQEGNLLPDPFLDIQSKIRSTGSEQGLLGIAFHPDYASNGFFYLNYTDTQGDSVIARYTVSAQDANRGDANSEQILLRVDQPYANHNGGGMAFGPDGYLYIALGDGGSANDPQGNAQSLDTHLGKLLRIDINGGDPYAVPADNPFASGGGVPEIWAYGLRNPWRFSFDRATGDLYIADVGQNAWEEIDFLPAGSPGGANFGWDYLEGSHPYEGTPPADAQLTGPIYEYQHGLGCSVTGGYVYRGQQLPEFSGIYLFSDYCSGRVWGLLRGEDGAWQGQELFSTGMNISSFGEDAQGEIYLIDQASGTVYRLQRNQ